MSKIGSVNIGTMYLGGTKIAKAYLGGTLVFSSTHEEGLAYLTFRSTGSNTLSVTCNGNVSPTLYYSRNAISWTLWDFSSLSFSSSSPLYIYGDNQSGLSTSSSDYMQFVIEGTGTVDCYGSVASLINGESNLAIVPCSYCFFYLFKSCAKLRTAPELPFTTLKEACYQTMFYQCTSLTSAPELPATNLAANCYRSMFYGCSALTTASELPATTLQTYCYYQMFYNCKNLVNIPEILPATTLQTYCYYKMFYNCSKIVTAPDLPALSLRSNCYTQMFYGCSKLKSIKAMFTTTPTSTYTNYWVYGVASSGTFTKNSSATWTTTGNSGVPSSWTIEYASS